MENEAEKTRSITEDNRLAAASLDEAKSETERPLNLDERKPSCLFPPIGVGNQNNAGFSTAQD